MEKLKVNVMDVTDVTPLLTRFSYDEKSGGCCNKCNKCNKVGDFNGK